MSLVGREDECRQLDQLLDSVRGGVSATLVLRGEPGIGKTALVDYAIEAASDMQTVVLVGIESEVGLGFGALQRVLVPIMHWIPRLPEPQQDALNAAFGKASGSYADPFLIGMAALSLAAESAARQPLLWVVDDAQWIDRESLNAFAFCGRRFAADPVALIFADRSTPEPEPVLHGFEVLTVSRLDAKDALSLFLERSVVMPDQGIAGRVIEETAGNPLALVELAGAVSAGTLNEAWLAPEPLPLSNRLEERFLGTVRSLPADTQTWLLLVAADTTGDPSLLWKAAGLLALPPTAADSAEASQLLTLLPKVVFRHPLIRSAVYGGASPAQRRAVHAALADATDDHRDDNRRSWHRGAAAVAPDEDIALALERAAAHVGHRGGRSGESAFLSRAADLTPDPWMAAQRRISAAEAALAAGLPIQTQAQIDLIDVDGADANLRSRVERASGSSWLLLRQPSRAAPVLLAAAIEVRDSGPEMRRRTLLEAVEAAFLSDFASVPLKKLAEAIESEGQTVEAPTIVEALLDGFATYVTQGYTAAVPALRHLIAVAQGDSVPRPELVRWAVFASHGASLLWDHDAHVALMARLIAACRQVGALSRLVDALQAAGASALRSGGLPVAELYFAEAAELSVAVDVPAASLAGFSLDAWRGDELEARRKIEALLSLASERDLASTAFHARTILTTLDLGTGRYQHALEQAKAVFDADPVPYGTEVLPDMVEAAARVGDLNAASLAVRRLYKRATASATPWALSVLARSQALLAVDADAEALYLLAIEKMTSTKVTFEVARTRLLYGEWLRRLKRRTDARVQLRTAFETFEALGASSFVTRARDELLATGEHARARTVDTSSDLTPQERHVAELAAAGETNAEIAARLFISRHTVEYHLRKVFRKLGITSRRGIKSALDNKPSAYV